MNFYDSRLQNWIPIKLFVEQGQQLCQWLHVGNLEFNDPFFDGTLHRAKALAENQHPFKSASGLNSLVEWSKEIPTTSPAAIIFHVSRCGSTLATQMLSLDKSNIVLSEVPFFDQLLNCRKFIGQDQFSSFAAALNFYSAKRFPEQQRCFIKTDSWHVFFYEGLRSIFPDTPFVFLYRKPEEVIRSHQRKRGMQMVPGLVDPLLFGFDRETIVKMDFDEFAALVLEQYFTRFLEILKSDPLAYAINYNEGPMVITDKILQITNVNINTELRRLMQERSAYHAKYPREVFAEPVMEAEPPAYQQPAFKLYEQLEAHRLSSNIIIQYKL